MKKKILAVLSSLTIFALLFVAGCSCGGDETEPETSIIGQIQTDMTQLKADMDYLEVSVEDLRTDIDNLGSSTVNQQVSVIQSQITTINSNFDGVKTQLDVLSDIVNNYNGVDYSGDIDSLRIDLTSLANTVSTISSSLDTVIEEGCLDNADLQNQIDELAYAIIDLQGQIDDIDVTVDLTDIEEDIAELQADLATVVDDYLEGLQADINTIVAAIISLQNEVDALDYTDIVEITRFVPESTYAEVRVNSGGDYAIVITMYGSGLDAVVVTIPSSYEVKYDNASTKYNKNYDGGEIRIIILEPEDTIDGTTITQNNWVSGQTIELDFAYNGGVIDYMSIGTASR